MTKVKANLKQKDLLGNLMSEEDNTEMPLEKTAVEKWTIPFGASADTLTSILKTFYVAGADAKYVARADVINRGVNKNNMGFTLPFLVSLGAIEKKDNDTDQLKLTPIGSEYARSAYASDKEKTKSSLRALLESSYKELIDYVNLKKESLTFVDLFNHIKAMARVKEDDKYGVWKVNPAYQTGIFALIDLLKISGFIDESLTAPVKAPVKPSERSTPKTVVQKSAAQRQPKTIGVKTPETEVVEENEKNFQLTTAIQVQITVDSKDTSSVDNFLRMIRALKELNEGNTSSQIFEQEDNS
jgi:hypothetical protein